MIEPALPFVVVPAGAHDAHVVRGRSVGHWVEISLSLAARHRHLLGQDSYEVVQLLAMKRFPLSEIAAYSTYAGRLEDAAQLAAHGELSHTVHTAAEDGKVVVALVARLLDYDGRVHTEISPVATWSPARCSNPGTVTACGPSQASTSLRRSTS
jgi:hypothetical protein